MRSSLRSFRYAPDSDGREGFFGDLRESFTDLFAYDRFDWPDLPSPSSVAFHAIKPVEGARGSSGIADDPVTLYTTTNSDVPIRTFGQVVEVDGGTVPLSNTSGPVIGVDDFRLDARFAGIDGSGYSVVVLDSGIDLDDPFFGPDANNDGVADRIVYHYDFADNDADASDVDGHGSNVTSIAASSDGTYTGMAPGADIISLKVFSDNGSGFFSDIEQALQWVINNAEAYNIASVNMSLGDGGNYGSPVGLYGIADELSVLASMDVIVVSASGNSFYEVNSIQGVAYPSADPNSLSVGAVYDSSGGGFSYGSGAIAYSRTTDQITPFSQRDDNLSDVFAPGAPITGAGAGAGLTTMHGTSQAAPHIAGIAVLAQQLAEQELGRKLTVTEFTDLLASSGDSIFDGDDEDDNVVNTGSTYQRVNVLALAEAIIALAPPDLDPAVFSISALDAEKPEGDSGTTGYSFTVTRSGNTSGNDSVDYGITGSGADPSDADDFQGGGFPSGQVTFAPGETSKVVTVEVLGDSDLESDEGFTVTLSNPSVGAQISIDSADGTIQNDDTAPPPPGETVVLIDSDFDDPGAGADGFTYVADAFGGTTGPSYTRGAWSEGELTMLLGGSDNDDIFDMSGGWQRSFTLDQDAEVSLSFLYTLTQAQSYEADEYSQVLFSLNGGPPQLVAEIVGDGNGGGEKTTGQQAFVADLGLLPAGTHTIVLGGYNNKKTYNNESTEIRFDDVQVTGTPTAPPATFLAIAADDAVKAEGDGGSTAFTFTVTRTGDTSQAGSVDYAVTSTQADGADFLGGVLPGGTVAFGAGEASKTLTVEVAGDTDFEGDEAFTVTLSNPSAGSEITGASAAGTIQNDDPVPPATFLAIAADDAVKAEGDGGSTAFTFTVTRTGDTSQAGSVDYAVTSAEADGTDFFGGTLPSGTVAFGAGEASKTLTIEVAGDTDFEGDEAFTVTLSNAST
uniref:S8 family serine peptidase n=1 Tax=Pelagibius sp. TaxID=1931238 RepID=UPI00260AAEEE